MAHRRVRELMTATPACVGESTPYQEIVDLQALRRVSALPVVDAGNRLVGIVSEADLLPKVEWEGGADRPPLADRLRHPARSVKASGLTARDLMTRDVVTIGPDESVVAAARLLERRRLRVLPVVDSAGRLTGTLSRGDVLRVFLADDEQIRREVAEDVCANLLRLAPPQVTVKVRHGVVTLEGQVETRSTVRIAERLAHAVDGVVDVVNHLVYVVDDLRPGGPEPVRPAPTEVQVIPGTSGPYGWWHDPTSRR